MTTIKTNNDPTVEIPIDIRIVCLNREKTRKTDRRTQLNASGVSETVYQVYFDLSESTTLGWRRIFDKEWAALNQSASPNRREWEHAGEYDASVTGKFLEAHCPLQEVAGQLLPALKKAVAAANVSYRKFLIEQGVEEDHRNDVWKLERKTVDTLAESLQF